MSIDHGRSIDTIYPLGDNPTLSEIDEMLAHIPRANASYEESANVCDRNAKIYMRDGREMSAGKCRGEARIFRQWIEQNNERAEQLKAIRLRLETIRYRDNTVDAAFDMLNATVKHCPEATETGRIFDIMVECIRSASNDIHAMGGE